GLTYARYVRCCSGCWTCSPRSGWTSRTGLVVFKRPESIQQLLQRISRIQGLHTRKVRRGETMKRFVTCICALAICLYFSNASAYAQGKSGGHIPAAAESHAADHGDHGSGDHGDHGKGLDNDKTHGTTHTNETHTQAL